MFAGVQVASTMWQEQLAIAAVFIVFFMASCYLLVSTPQKSPQLPRDALHPDGRVLHRVQNGRTCSWSARLRVALLGPSDPRISIPEQNGR